jgi:small-conductance mechanosensitive channel
MFLAAGIDAMRDALGSKRWSLQRRFGWPGPPARFGRGWLSPLPWLPLLLVLAVWINPLQGIPSAAASAPPAPSVWVTLDGQPVLELRSVAGAQSLPVVARRVSQELVAFAERASLPPESLVVEEDPPYSTVGIRAADGRFQPRFAVDDRAARAFGVSRQQLALRYRDQLRSAVTRYRSEHSLGNLLRGTALALLVLLIYVLWWRGQSGIRRRLARLIDRRFALGSGSADGLRLGGRRVLDAELVHDSLRLLLITVHWLLLGVISYLLIPLLLSLFPPTRGISDGLRSQLLGLLGRLSTQLVGAIPELFTLVVILLLTQAALGACGAWFGAIERGRLQFSGFYPEWAAPTRRLVSLLILLVAVVIAYPYVPGSGSKVFQGAGLFVGVFAALGSSAVASNIISGLMLIYTRAFQEGDRVEINGVVGVVQERALLVTRIRTPRHELVSLPNATVIAASIVNFSFPRREMGRPVAIAVSLTLGYDIPWRQVEQLLLRAAERSSLVLADPSPFVLQTSLNDHHITYELNACIGEEEHYREAVSALLASIQDCFAEADVEILSPAYAALRDGSGRTVPS